jgi:hypothetical protein
MSDTMPGQISKPRCLAVIPMTAYRISTPYPPYERLQFSISVGSFEKKTKLKLEKGKIYHIIGNIGGICAFEKRLFGSNKIVIVVPSGHRGVISAGKYDVEIVSVEERRRFKVHRETGDCGVVVIRDLDLQSMRVAAVRRGCEVVELVLRKVSEKDEPLTRVFANVQSGNGFVRFPAAGVGLKPGDEFEVVSQRKYTVRDLVKEFNGQKPDAAQNVELTMSGDNILGMKVDGKQFLFTKYSLLRLRSKLLLRTKLSFYKMELRFWFDGKRFQIRLGVNDVVGFWIAKNGKLRFESPFDEKAVAAQRELYLQVQRLRNPVLREFEHLLKKLKVISQPSGIAGIYAFKVDDQLCSFVCSKLENLSRNEYSTRKGSFGEMIACQILSLRYSNIREHPSVRFPKAAGCHKAGVDYEMISEDSEAVDLLESKWWGNVSAAINQGHKEIRKRIAERRLSYRSGLVRAAFVAAVDWDPEMRRGTLVVVKAERSR